MRGTNNLAPFQYAINSFNFGGSGRFTGLSAGNYRLYAKNSIGCLDSLKATLTQPTLLVNTTTKNDNLCFGDNTGNLSVQVSGGVSPYQFSIDNVNYVSGNTFGNLTAGNYTTYIKDAHGCITPQGVELIQPSNIIVTPIYSDTIRCWGELNGKVTIQATGGTPGYQYSMDNSNYFGSNSFGNLGKGIYTFYVKDTHQCVRQANLTLTQPDSLKLSFVSKIHPLCYQSSDGTIQVSSVGGNGGNLYQLNTIKTQATTRFESLAQGTYTVVVTDRKGCTDRVSNIVLTHPTQLVHSISTVEPLCKGDKNGSVTINVNGGTKAYLLNIDGVDYSPMQGDNVFLFGNQGARTYQFTTKDANKCIDKFEVKLGEPTRLHANAVVTPNWCFGDSTGVIALFGQGATPPYKYSIVNGYRINDTTFTNTNYYDKLLSKTYLIRLKDAHECRYDSLVNVPQPTQVTFAPYLADSVRCFGEVNGKIAIKAQGGIPGYTYSLDNKNYQTSDTLTKLKAGYYQLFVRDSHECLAKQDSFQVKQPDLLQATLAAKTDPLCAGEQNGTIKLKAVGGNRQYTYIMDNSLKQKEPLFEKLTQGSYTFKITDWKGCEDTVTLVSLKWPQALAADVTPTQPVCFGDANATLKIEVSGGVGGYSAQLYKGSLEELFLTQTSLNDIIQPEETKDFSYKNLTSGEYTALVNDKNGCQLLIPSTIKEAVKLNSKINLGGELRTADSVVVCKGQLVTLNAQNEGMEIRWFRDKKELPYYNNQNEIENDTTGTYIVKVTNPTGCVVSDTFSLKNNNKALKADFLIPTQAFVGDTVVCLDITKPIPDKVLWSYPAQAFEIEKSYSKLTTVFNANGDYKVGMLAFVGECKNMVFHSIKIFNREDVALTDSTLGYQSQNLIKQVDIFPNPNYGVFRVKVDLTKTADMQLRIIRIGTGQSVYDKTFTGNITYTEDLSLKVFPDTYLVQVNAIINEKVVATHTTRILITY